MLSSNNNSSNSNKYDIYEVVIQIHKYNEENNKRFVITPTGGGISSIALLFSQPGASSSILECTVPYACESTLEYTNSSEIKSWASFDTANRLAYSAFLRCNKLIKASSKEYNAIGIGATCNLVSNGKWKQGEHGIYISCKSDSNMVNFHLNLYKGIQPNPFRTRQEEDEVCGKLIVCVCAYECGLFDNDSLLDFMTHNGLSTEDSLRITNDPIHELLNGKMKHLVCRPQEKAIFEFTQDFELGKLVMLPGSFNPLHKGHTNALVQSMKLVASSIGMYELSITNAAKPTLSYGEIISRLNNFRNQSFPILLTIDAPLFIKKAEDYPNSTFVIGIDTLLRLFDPKFGEPEKTLADFKRITTNGTRFIVFPRNVSSASIASSDDTLTLNMVKDKIPPELFEFFTEVTDNEFMDVSSSKLRK
jgi:hypothetical protein